jgi:hypothetical protein
MLVCVIAWLLGLHDRLAALSPDFFQTGRLSAGYGAFFLRMEAYADAIFDATDAVLTLRNPITHNVYI